MDQDAINLAKAIRQQESGGDFNKVGDAGTSHGAYQWQPDTWKEHANTILGDPNAKMTPDNQQAVAYGMIKTWKDQGLNPAQIAAKWNSGQPDGWENKIGTATINGKKVPYNVPQYVKNVTDNYQKLKNPTPETPAAPTLTPNQVADQSSAKEHGAFFAANTNGDQNPLVEGAKSLGNFIPSAFNFAKGALDMINPISTVKKIAAIGTNFGALSQESGGVGNALKAAVGELPGAAYDTAKGFIPEAVRDVSSAAFAGATGSKRFGTVDENLQAAQRAAVNDPFGTAAPLVFALEGGAKLADNMASKAAMKNYVENIGDNVRKPIPEPSTAISDIVDKTISKTGQMVTKPAGYVFGKAGDAIGSAAKYGASQLTGLDRSTLKTAAENPGVDLTKLNRTDLGQEIQSNLTKRVADLSDTGKEYGSVRANTAPIKVEPNFIDDAIKKETGLDIDKKGNLKAKTTSKIRDSGDVRAIQKVYDLWKPAFKKGSITAEEFLNFREDLAKAAKFEKDIGKRADVDLAAGRIRAKFNNTYRSQIPGLTELDAKISPQIGELKELRKGLVDKNGNLTDSGLTKIAKVTENRPALAAQLEKISPGILKKVKMLQAAEDLRAASEKFKVGTYAKQAGQYGLIGGIATMNPVLIGGSIAEMILTNPENAIKMIQKYGASKEVISAAMEKLGNAKGKLSPYVGKTLLKSGAFSARDQQPK